MAKSTPGKAFENRCKGVIVEMLGRRTSFRMPENRGWELLVLFWIPRLETVQWLDRGEGARFTRKDTDAPIKVTMDGVNRALATDDSANIRVTTEKRDGRGDCWVDFMLKEVHVPIEPRNATEVACEINARGGPIRASPTDEPALLEHLRSRVPDMGEYRLTAFDQWRIDIMLHTNLVFEQMQGRVICPARTGRLDACFDCSDMKVINCIMNNPRVITDEGKAAGWFDLCSQKMGTYVALLDGPKGGGSMAKEETKKTLDMWFSEYLLNMQVATNDPGRIISAMIAAGKLVEQAKEVKGADEQKKAYAICARLAVALFHQHEAGSWKPLPQDAPSYRTTTKEQFPPEVLKLVKEMRDKLNEKEKGKDWMAPALAAQYYYNLVVPPVREAQEKGLQPWKKLAEEPAKAEEPKARKKRTPKEETPADEVPAVLGNASIDIQDEGMPKVREIPAGEQLELAATEEREEIEAEEASAEGDSDADLAALLGDEEAPKPAAKALAKATPKAVAKPPAPATPAKEKLMETIIGKDPVLNELKALRAELAAFKQEQAEKQTKYKENIAAINKWLLDHYTDDRKFKDDMRIELNRLSKFLDDYEAAGA